MKAFIKFNGKAFPKANPLGNQSAISSTFLKWSKILKPNKKLKPSRCQNSGQD